VRKAFFVFATACSIANPALAQSKPAWQWTLDERLADRFDPTRIRERDEAYVAKFRQLRAMRESNSRDTGDTDGKQLQYRIDGSRNPELFLPHELFVALLGGLSSDASRRVREREAYRSRLRREGFDAETFWPALESVSAAYLPLKNREQHSGGEVDTNCRARYEALQRARALFGADRFDHLLYSVVAAGMSFGTGTTYPNPAERLRREADGCREPLTVVTPSKRPPA